MKRIALIILVFISCNQEKPKDFSIESSIENIDSLLSKANNFKAKKADRLLYALKADKILYNKSNDSLVRSYFFKLAGRYYNLEEYDRYLEVSRRVHKMSQEANDKSSIAKSLSYIGDYYYYKFKTDSAYYYYSKAEKAYFKLKNTEDIVRVKFWKANILFYEKDFSGCETAIINILKIAKQRNDVRLIYDCYLILGNSLEGLNNQDKALEYYQKAYEITDELKNDSQYLLLKAQPFNFIGRVYQKKEDYNKSVFYFENALGFGDFKSYEPLMYANLINNVAYSKLKLGDQSAGLLLTEALKIRTDLDNTPGVISSKINLAEYYLAQKDTAKAFLNSKSTLKTAHKNKIYEDELKLLELLSKVDPENSTIYIDRFIKLTDSLQNNERATRNKFARIEFETDEILNQKNDIEAEKNKISSQRWIILGFSAFFILSMALLYITKSQHAKNKQLQSEKEQQQANEEIYRLMLDQQSKIDEGRQNEKKRISQELHDGIMSKLTSTRLNLFILSKKTDEETIKKCLSHIAGLQDIEKEIRAISHDLSKDIFSGKDSFITIIEALFDAQKSISETNYHLETDDKINWEAIESTTKMHLYRIFQEALQNIHKYAQAKNVSASMDVLDNSIHIEIIDDGIGFDVKKAKAGIGLKNMQSRIKTIQGEIDIISQKGKGTQISLLIPK